MPSPSFLYSIGGSPIIIVPITKSRSPSLLKSAHATLLVLTSRIPDPSVTSLNVPLPLFLEREILLEEIRLAARNRSCKPSSLKSPHAAVAPSPPMPDKPVRAETSSNVGIVEELLFELPELPEQEANKFMVK